MNRTTLGVVALLILAAILPHGEGFGCNVSGAIPAGGKAAQGPEFPSPHAQADGCGAQVHSVLNLTGCCACGAALLQDLRLTHPRAVRGVWQPTDPPSPPSPSSHPWRPPA